MLKLLGNTGDWSEWKTYDNKRPIDIAAEYGHIEIALTYLSKNNNTKGINALIRAAIRHRTGNVLTVVQNAYRDEDDSRYYNALHYACRQFYGHQSIESVISKCDMSIFDENGYNPLMLAIKHHQVNSV